MERDPICGMDVDPKQLYGNLNFSGKHITSVRQAVRLHLIKIWESMLLLKKVLKDRMNRTFTLPGN
jgi:hypothetical protein